MLFRLPSLSFVFTLTTLLVAVSCNDSVYAQPVITVRTSSTVQGDDILLGEIASIEGPFDFIRSAERVIIGKAPSPERERTFHRKQILARLRHNDIDTSEITLVCPKELSVVTDYVEFDSNHIRMIVKKHIHRNMPWNPERVKIENIICKPVRILNGNITHSVTARRGEDYRGRFVADIEFFRNGQHESSEKVSATIRVYSPVVVAARQINKNAVLLQQDLKTERREITAYAKTALLERDVAIGQTAKRYIPQGTIIKQSMIEHQPVLERGDIVTLCVETKSFKITAPGKVLQDGLTGDLIEVSNLSSGKKLYGRVVDNNRVRIVY